MTEDERLEKLVWLADLCRRDADVSMMMTAVVTAERVTSIGELAVEKPEVFDLLVEQAVEMASLGDGRIPWSTQ